MNCLLEKELEIINAGGTSVDLDFLISCGTVAIGSRAYLMSEAVSVPATLGVVALYNVGFIGTYVLSSNILS